MLRLLLWLQWRQWQHRSFTARRIWLPIIIGLAALGFSAGFVGGAAAIGATGGLPVLRGIAAIAFLTLAVFIVLLSLPQVYGQLYGGRDLELLFTLPIPTRSIFLFKYGQTVLFAGLVVIGIIYLPAIAFGITAGAAPLYYLILTIAVIAFATGAVAGCYLLTLALVRVLPQKRIKEILTVIQGLAGLLGALSGQMSARLGRVANAGDALPQLPDWLPTSWAAIALDRAAHGQLDSLVPLLGTVVVGGGSLALSLMLVERGFRLGWVRMSEGGGRRRATRSERRAARRPSLNSPTMAIARKELTMLRRDVREWMAFLPILVFLGVGLFQLFGRSRPDEFDDYPMIIWLFLQAGLVLITSFFGSSFAAPAFARDELASWVLRTVPLAGQQITIGKFLVYWGLMMAFVIIIELAAAIAFSWPIGLTVAGIFGVLVLLAGSLALGMWTGTFGARYDPNNPNNRLTTGASFLFMGVDAIYLLIAIGVFLLTLIPTDLEPLLTEAASGAGGFIGIVVAIALGIVRLKIAHPLLMTGLGLFWLLFVGLGTTAGMLWLTARRVDAGVQIEIVEQR